MPAKGAPLCGCFMSTRSAEARRKAAGAAKRMRAPSGRKAVADGTCRRRGQDLLPFLREKIPKRHVALVIETAGDDRPVAEHGGLLPQGKAAPARAAVAGGELRPLEPLAVLDEHARRKTPAPRVFVPLVRKGGVQCGEDVIVSRMETLGLCSVEIPQTVVDENAARPKAVQP